jgi:hypothetical protein
MAREYDWIQHELLGDIDEIAPPLADVPSIPWLDEPPTLRNMQKSGNAADELCAKLDRDDLIDTLCPIPTEAQIAADVQKFAPDPKPAPGWDSIIKEVMPAARVLEEWTPKAHQMFANLIKMARPSRRKQINDRLERHGLYRHELRNKWNEMLISFDNDATVALPDNALLSKATSFLAEGRYRLKPG